jgi:hypothetical protein
MPKPGILKNRAAKSAADFQIKRPKFTYARRKPVVMTEPLVAEPSFLESHPPHSLPNDSCPTSQRKRKRNPKYHHEERTKDQAPSTRLLKSQIFLDVEDDDPEQEQEQNTSTATTMSEDTDEENQNPSFASTAFESVWTQAAERKKRDLLDFLIQKFDGPCLERLDIARLVLAYRLTIERLHPVEPNNRYPSPDAFAVCMAKLQQKHHLMSQSPSISPTTSDCSPSSTSSDASRASPFSRVSKERLSSAEDCFTCPECQQTFYCSTIVAPRTRPSLPSSSQETQTKESLFRLLLSNVRFCLRCRWLIETDQIEEARVLELCRPFATIRNDETLLESLNRRIQELCSAQNLRNSVARKRGRVPLKSTILYPFGR